jgi:hypothetical protein
MNLPPHGWFAIYKAANAILRVVILVCIRRTVTDPDDVPGQHLGGGKVNLSGVNRGKIAGDHKSSPYAIEITEWTLTIQRTMEDVRILGVGNNLLHPTLL